MDTRGLLLLAVLLVTTTSGFVFNIRSVLKPTRNPCKVRLVRMTIHPPRQYAHICQPTTLYTQGCKGGCESYSKIDKHNATNIQSYCSCCSQTKTYTLPRVALPCTDGRVLPLTVKAAASCHCKPCSMSVGHMDNFSLRRLLEDNPVNFFGG